MDAYQEIYDIFITRGYSEEEAERVLADIIKGYDHPFISQNLIESLRVQFSFYDEIAMKLHEMWLKSAS